MRRLWLLLAGLLLAAVLQGGEAQRRPQWFLTGRDAYSQRSFEQFPAQHVDRWQALHRHASPREEPLNHTELSFGGALAVLEEKDGNVSKHVDEFLVSVLQLPQGAEEDGSPAPASIVPYVSLMYTFGIFVTKDYEQPYGLEIGLMDEFRRDFIERKIHSLRLGKEFRLVVVIPQQSHDDQERVVDVEHHIILAEDIRGRLSLTQHTWRQVSVTSSLPSSNGDQEKNHFSTNGYNVRLMSYNIWHNNPPTWVVSARQRTSWYGKRLSLLAQYITEEDPDIITLQEVRLDSGFPHEFHSPDDDISDENTAVRVGLETAGRKPGSQMHHMLDALQQHIASTSDSSTSECKDVLCKYQLVYQPAMSMHDRNKPFERNEEGVAMLVRATATPRRTTASVVGTIENGDPFRLQVSRTQPFFLPRDMENKMDDHHRVILHTEVELVPTEKHNQADSSGERENPLIDVMTTHLSLSSPARVLSMQNVWQFSTTSTPEEGNAHDPNTNAFPESSIGYTKGHVQILTGDFNAEPNEPAYRYITGQLSPEEISEIGEEQEKAYNNNIPNFRDAWILGGSLENEADGFTFPSCNPIKRIDFILVRNKTKRQGCVTPDTTHVQAYDQGQDSSWKASVLRTRRVGLEPTIDTVDRVGSREGLGMLDMDSPIWASDHYALVSDMWIYHENGDESPRVQHDVQSLSGDGEL